MKLNIKVKVGWTVTACNILYILLENQNWTSYVFMYCMEIPNLQEPAYFFF